MLTFYDSLLDLIGISLEEAGLFWSFLKAEKVGILDCSCSWFFLFNGCANREGLDSSSFFYFSSVFLNSEGPSDVDAATGFVSIVFYSVFFKGWLKREPSGFFVYSAGFGLTCSLGASAFLGICCYGVGLTKEAVVLLSEGVLLNKDGWGVFESVFLSVYLLDLEPKSKRGLF